MRGSEARAVHPTRRAVGTGVHRRPVCLVRLRSLPMADVASVEAIGGRGSARGKRAHCTRRNRNALAALLGLRGESVGESRVAALRLHSVLGRGLFPLTTRATARLELRQPRMNSNEALPPRRRASPTTPGTPSAIRARSQIPAIPSSPESRSMFWRRDHAPIEQTVSEPLL